MEKKRIRTKTIVGGVIAAIYFLATTFASIKSNISLWFFSVFFLVGLVFFLAPTEALLRFDRKMGYFLYITAPDEESGLGCANIFFTLFGLIFMLMPMAFSLDVLFR